MFSALRKGSPVYILFKDDIPTFVKGTVESTTYPTYNTNYYNSITYKKITFLIKNKLVFNWIIENVAVPLQCG